MVGNSSDWICAEIVIKVLFDYVYGSVFITLNHVLANISEGKISFDSFASGFRTFSVHFSKCLNLIIRDPIHFDDVLLDFITWSQSEFSSEVF